jgi:FixJ family two-component response regulator
MNGNGTKDDANGKAKRGWVKTEQGWEPTDSRMQQIVFQIKAGRPFKEIAAQFNIAIARVSAIRRRAHIPRRIPPAESI